MQSITTIGLDIAKSVFQVHGVGVDGNVILRRQLKRRYVLAQYQISASDQLRNSLTKSPSGKFGFMTRRLRRAA